MTLRSVGPWSVPPGQSEAFSPAMRRSHASGEASGASEGKTLVQPSGKVFMGPG